MRDQTIARVAFWTAVVAVGTVLATVAALAVPAVRRTIGGGSAVPAYAIGDTVDLPRTIFAGRPQTLVVLASASCSACRASQPWLAKLAAMPDRFVLSVVMSDSRPEPAKAFAKEAGISVDDQLHLVDISGLRLKWVPTLLLLDANGVVHFEHEGVLTQAVVDELLASPELAAAGD